jgi:hypothetical protein
VKQRQTQSGGLFDALFAADFVVYKVKEGENRLRFLPPTWRDAQHYAIDLFVHYGVGSDNGSYFCAAKMKGEGCLLCELRKEATKEGDIEYAASLSATKRVLAWVIDRDEEDAGPQLFPMAWTIDRDLANLSIDKRTGELLLLDDPDRGYDVEFTAVGTGLKRRYSGLLVSRHSSLLHDDSALADKWLDYVQNNPLPGTLVYYDQDHIRSVAEGRTVKRDDGDDGATRRERAGGTGGRDTREHDERPPFEDEDLPPRRPPIDDRRELGHDVGTHSEEQPRRERARMDDRGPDGGTQHSDDDRRRDERGDRRRDRDDDDLPPRRDRDDRRRDRDDDDLPPRRDRDDRRRDDNMPY